uniref:Uncharacterized protein n=1 Tax=viral metagenome TaxID=1070528 RepID=A0A6M3IED5_9ZZZZ
MTIIQLIELLREFRDENKRYEEEYAKEGLQIMKVYCRGRREAFETAIRFLIGYKGGD